MNKPSARSFDSLAALSCIGVLICWSSAPLFIKYLTGYLDLWTQNLLRYLSACLFWLPFLVIELKAGRVPKQVWKRTLVPFVLVVIMQTLWAAVFYYIDPGFVSLLAMTAFLWVIIMSIIFFAEERRLLSNRMFVSSIVLSLVGLAGVMYFHPKFTHSYTITGIVIVLCYGFIWGLYSLSVKTLLKGIDSRVGFSIISIYTFVTLLIGILFKGNLSQCLAMPFWGWFAVVISGILGIAVGHVLYYVSIRRLSAATSSLTQLSQPFIVATISFFLFGETLSVLQWIFGIVLVAGSALAIIAEKTPDLPELPIG
jgi:drug/metabolite transporter (DMT)-like permease